MKSFEVIMYKARKCETFWQDFKNWCSLNWSLNTDALHTARSNKKPNMATKRGCNHFVIQIYTSQKSILNTLICSTFESKLQTSHPNETLKMSSSRKTKIVISLSHQVSTSQLLSDELTIVCLQFCQPMITLTEEHSNHLICFL